MATLGALVNESLTTRVTLEREKEEKGREEERIFTIWSVRLTTTENNNDLSGIIEFDDPKRVISPSSGSLCPSLRGGCERDIETEGEGEKEGKNLRCGHVFRGESMKSCIRRSSLRESQFPD